MVKLGDKSVCLWHAFNTLAMGDTSVVNKSKLKVLTHNIANCLGVQKIEEQMVEHFEPKEINFKSYLAFIQSELLSNFQLSDIKNGAVDLDKVDEVCWFVSCKDYIQHATAFLNTDNIYALWKMFNAVADRNYDEKLPVIPVVADCEEIGIIAEKYCSILGQTFDSSDFKTLSAKVPKFSFSDVLNLWNTQLCKDIDKKLMTNALKELQDEIVYETIKKGRLVKKGHMVASWKERWFVLTLTDIKYYSNATEKDLKGELPIGTVSKTELIPDVKGSKIFRFKICSAGKCLEISASDMRTRSEWITAINLAIENSKEMVETPQQLARKQRHYAREEHMRKLWEEQEEKNRTQEEMQNVKAGRAAAEAKALEEEKRRMSTALELEAQKLAREKAEARALQEEDRLKQERANLENTQGQLEAEKQARADAEARLIAEAALREAEQRRLEELEVLQKQLEQLLEEERQAKKDEEIVRNLQSKVLEEEFEKREELESLKEELQSLLKEEQQRTAGLEEVKISQEVRLQEEQSRLEEMEKKRRLLDEELQDAKIKLEEAEKAKIEMVKNLKMKQREKPVFRLAPELPDDGEFHIVTHRGHGAFCDADFGKSTSESTSSRNNSITADHDDSGVSAENSPVFERKSCHSDDS